MLLASGAFAALLVIVSGCLGLLCGFPASRLVFLASLPLVVALRVSLLAVRPSGLILFVLGLSLALCCFLILITLYHIKQYLSSDWLELAIFI
jgi:hypothetical protein